jgi:glycogen debranching enzyme
MAHLHEISQAPNYVSVDSTPLFLILIASYTQWTGDLRLFDELKRNVDAALRWIDDDGDANRDGYVEYGDAAQNGLSHQGWKDSASTIVNRDGSDAIPPISLVEVQGYVYLAKSMMAELYRQAGDADIADRLVQEAASLRERFNRDFWMEEEGCYCLALQGDGRQVSVIASNPGHALWSRIADEQKARRTAARLMQADMFSGWGIRSLSKNERAYNPILYHMGSVWPFDNALIVAGLRRYGLDDAARRVFAGMFEAASHFAAGRLPEFFIGFDREPDTFPGRCPSSDPLQAWSSGALPFMLEALLGIEPNAAERQLRIVRPILPDGVDRLSVRGLMVGSASVDLLFEADKAGTVSAVVLNKNGDLTVTLD